MGKEIIRYNQLPQGYGNFPYVIVRLRATFYMQIPIHLFGEIGQQSYEKYPGFQIYNLSDAVIALPHKKKIESIKTELICLTIEMQELIRNECHQTPRVCLVLDKDWCYFFEEKEINESDSIPDSGLLLNERMEIIGRHQLHFSLNLLDSVSQVSL